ncbi:MAG: ABC transporter permease [Telluria sp.]
MLRNYLLTAWKVFMRRKLFTAVNLLCIVLTLVVLMVVTAMLQHAFFPTGVEGKSDRFLQVIELTSENHEHTAMRNSPLGYKLISQYLRTLKTPEKVAAVSSPQTVAVYQGDRVTNVMMRRADAEYWEILDFQPLAGRLPTRDDVAQGRFVAVVNESTARKLFGRVDAVGQTFNAGGQVFSVIGVVKDVLHLNAYADVWVPVTTFPSTAYRDQLDGDFFALLLARSPADLPKIQREVQEAAKTVQFEDPRMWNVAYFWADSKLDVFARTLMSNRRQADSGADVLIGGVVALMLLFMLLPALNLVNLNVGRIMERASEIGVRKAFGATNRQLVGQFIVENVALSLVGGLLGLACAAGVLAWLNRSGLIPYLDVGVNLPVFGWGMLIAAVFGVLSGVIPAWKMARLDPVHALKGAA